jgi:transcriptional regulator with XRE-family HTH domain
MIAPRQNPPRPEIGSLGAYLRELRTRLDPAAMGYAGGRRRTRGLRREEVAERAGISANWYSWLEQGRGGAPSADALDRLAAALLLTEVEREHLFLLGLGRPPEVRYQPPAGVRPRLQHVLDAMDSCPAMIRTATWDVIAWNRAAAIVFNDYAALSPAERNVLRLTFLDPLAREKSFDWEGVARFVVGVFRGDTTRAGAAATVQPLVDELCAKSPDFAAMWRDSEVRGSCESVRRLRHPELGEIAFEFSAFAVDGRPDLALLVYTPVSADEATRIRALSAARAG